MHQVQSVIALSAIALVIVVSLRLSDVGWSHIFLVAVFIPTIVVVVRHGQKPHYEAHRVLQYRATHDVLTGLPNRTLFHERLQAAMQLAPRESGRFAVAMLDLDGFKAINDQHGHLAGDLLLQAVAERLRASVRASDTVARFGGDEFALILEGVTDIRVLLKRCHQLGDALVKPYTLAGLNGPFRATIGASMGLAMGANLRADPLIQAADKALYRAKAAGKNCCVLTDGLVSTINVPFHRHGPSAAVAA